VERYDLHPALARVYGEDETLLAQQARRYERGLAAFAAEYGPGNVWVLRAPGRVNLIGEHTDYQQGYVLPMALDRDVLVFARPRGDAEVHLANIEPGYGRRQFTLSSEIPPQPRGDWANYAQGPAQMLAQQYRQRLFGYDALVDGAPPEGVPRGSGLSSSSALVVAMAAVGLRLNNLLIDRAGLAALAGRAEWYVGTRGGVMDQFSAVVSRPGHALFLDCRPGPGDRYTYRHVPLPEGYVLAVVESGVRHANTGPHYNQRVAEARLGVRLLQAHYPEITHLRDVEEVDWDALAPLLPEAVTAGELSAQGIAPATLLDEGVALAAERFVVRRRCRHIHSENRRVLAAVEALEAGDMDRLGALMRAAHASARDDYEISTPEIDALVALADQVPGVLGARITGAGWGGCVVCLARAEAAEALAPALVPAYARATGREARVFVCRSSAGAGGALQTICG
jgi:galactokinase